MGAHMPRYRVTVRGAATMQREVDARDAEHAATKLGSGKVRHLERDLYADSLGRVIRVELLSNGEDEPLPITKGNE